MVDSRIRREIAYRAARLMYERVESEYFTAKRKAARQLGVDYKHRHTDLPSNREIRDEIQMFARIIEGDERADNLREMRIDALRMMCKLTRFRPRLIGSVWTGHIRQGSDIDIHVFSDSWAALTLLLEDQGLRHDVEHKRIVKFNEERFFTHIHVYDRHTYELTVYAEDKISYRFRSSITGKPIEGGNIKQLEALLRDERPDADLDDEVVRLEDHVDRFELYRFLLTPLENVKQNPKYHPEGDALFHSLQVFRVGTNRTGIR